MTSNGKQFTVTREMLTAVAGISARFSKFAFVLFCYITNHLMTGPLGNSEFCFPRISMFPSTSSRETLRFSGNKIHCSPRDQSLSVKCFIFTRLSLENYIKYLKFKLEKENTAIAFIYSNFTSLSARQNMADEQQHSLLVERLFVGCSSSIHGFTIATFGTASLFFCFWD